MITQVQIKKIFNYSDGKLFWKYRDSSEFKTMSAYKSWNTKYSGREAGTRRYDKRRNEYRISIRINGRSYLRSRLIYIYHNGNIDKKSQIDHLNGNTLDDTIKNLRLVNNVLNSYNTKKYKNNTSGKNGVYYNRKTKKWYAQARICNKNIMLYYGESYTQAVLEREKWEYNNPLVTERHAKNFQITNIVKLKAAGLDDDDILYR